MMKNTRLKTANSRYLTMFFILAVLAAAGTCSRGGSDSIDLIVAFSNEVRGYLEECG